MNKYIRLINFLKQIPGETCIKTGIGLGMTACSFVQAFCLAKGVAAVFGGRELFVVLRFLVICLLALLVRCFLVRYQEGYGKKMGAKVKAVIRNTMLDKLMLLGPAYRNDRRTGNLQSLITDGVESFEPFLVQYIPQTAVVLITTAVSTIYLWRLDASVGILLLLMAILSVIVPHLLMPAVSRVMIEYWQDYADLNAQYIDAMQGMSTLKSLGASQREGKKLEQRAWKFARESLKNLGISLSDSAVIVTCTVVGTSAGIAMAAWHMASGKLPYESLLIILFLAGECMKPINDMNTYWHSSYLGLSVAEELFAVLDESTALKDPIQSRPIPEKLPGMELDRISFKYETDTQIVLNDVKMTFAPGKVTAIVGKSGSGKSTIVNLLLRFYDPQTGAVKFDGYDIREYQMEVLRSQIGVVFQESYLFYGTVRENLLMADPNASEEQMIESAKTANAHEFITRLPNGYDTLVGERGATLSGGERQRISIARAVLKNAPILILDEATSSVDMIHESQIQEALNRIMKNRTTIVIAHRLSTIEHADYIYVMEKGKIVGEGTHAELLEKNQTYQGLIRAQNHEK